MKRIGFLRSLLGGLTALVVIKPVEADEPEPDCAWCGMHSSKCDLCNKRQTIHTVFSPHGYQLP